MIPAIYARKSTEQTEEERKAIRHEHAESP